MILTSPNSRIGIINLFSDFIVSKIPRKEKTIIKIVEFDNFVVIKGNTTHKEPLDINLIKDEFNDKFEKLNAIEILKNTIDLIQYNVKMGDVNSIKHIFYRNDYNCSYHKSQINKFKENSNKNYKYTDQILTSFEKGIISQTEFPHGHSMNQGRSLYYYGKHIFYNLPSNYLLDFSIFTLTEDKNEKNDLNFTATKNSNETDNHLTSAILDIFNFDTTEVKENITEEDWFNETINPLSEHELLTKKVKNFILF